MSLVIGVESAVGLLSRTCLFITSMHCGGGDQLAQVLHLLGADLPDKGEGDELSPGNVANAFSMPEPFAELSDEMLASAGIQWNSLETVSPAWYASPKKESFRQRARTLVQAAFANSPFFIATEPRMAKFVPFWLEVLSDCEIKPVVISLYRDPDDMARDLRSELDLDFDIARLLWLRNILEIERSTRSQTRTHISLAALHDDFDEVADKIASTAGISWPASSARVYSDIADFLQGLPKPVSSGAKTRGARNDWFAVARDVFGRWTASSETAEDRKRLDDLYTSFNDAVSRLSVPLEAAIKLGDELQEQKAKVASLLAEIGRLKAGGAAESGASPSAIGAAQSDQLEELSRTLIQTTGDRERDLDQLRAAHVAELERIRLQFDEARATDARHSQERWAKIFTSNKYAQDRLEEQNRAFQKSILQLSDELAATKAQIAENADEALRAETLSIAREAKSISKYKTIVSELNANIAERDAVAKKLRDNLDKRSEAIDKLRETLSSRDFQLANLRAQAEIDRAALKAAPPPKRKLGDLGEFLSPKMMLSAKARRKFSRLRHAREIIARSSLFDAAWYMARYPDVASAGANPLDHFIQFGGAEGRHPSEHFNSRWYLDQNPDIREAGLNPLVHYLEHGRDEGRLARPLAKQSGHDAISAAPASGSSMAPTPAPPAQVDAAPSEFQNSWRARDVAWAAMSSGTGLREWVSQNALAQDGTGLSIAVGPVNVARIGDDTPASATDRVTLFAALEAEAADEAREVRIAAASLPRSQGEMYGALTGRGLGIELVSDLWLAGEALLCVRLDSQAVGGPAALRAYQFGLDGELRCCGEALLAGTSVDFAEVRIESQHHGLLIVISNDDATLRQTIVLPFPSLARGGYHYGELASVETPPSYMKSLADYSQSLALELLGWPNGPEAFSVGRIEVDLRGATGIEPIFRTDMLRALAGRYGISFTALSGRTDGAMSDLALKLDSIEGFRAGFRADGQPALRLPADCLPSIYSLVSRRLTGASTTNYCIVDAATLQPMACVRMPAAVAQLPRFQHADLPAHLPFLAVSEPGEAEARCAVVSPLAVRYYNPLAWQIDPLMPVSPDQEMPLMGGAKVVAGVSGPLVTVVIDLPRGADIPHQVLTALSMQSLAERIEVLFLSASDREPGPLAGEVSDAEVFFTPPRRLACSGMTRAMRLNHAVTTASGRYVLIVDPETLLVDPRTAEILVGIAEQPGVASASCAIVSEDADGGVTIHTAGYFPTRTGFQGSPRSDFTCQSVETALPAATYPVVANQMKCCLVSVEAWRSLGGLDVARFPAARFDLDFGFRAITAGMTNYCTTLIRAASTRGQTDADFPDAIAQRWDSAIDWHGIVERTTTIRELHR